MPSSLNRPRQNGRRRVVRGSLKPHSGRDPNSFSMYSAGPSAHSLDLGILEIGQPRPAQAGPRPTLCLKQLDVGTKQSGVLPESTGIVRCWWHHVLAEVDIESGKAASDGTCPGATHPDHAQYSALHWRIEDIGPAQLAMKPTCALQKSHRAWPAAGGQLRSFISCSGGFPQ
jgi:hypothetical protein